MVVFAAFYLNNRFAEAHDVAGRPNRADADSRSVYKMVGIEVRELSGKIADALADMQRHDGRCVRCIDLNLIGLINSFDAVGWLINLLCSGTGSKNQRRYKQNKQYYD